MNTPRSKHTLYRLYNDICRKKLKWLKTRLSWKRKEMDLKTEVQKNSHSLFWVWEFSKKAVLVCFIFYIVTQAYSMAVMVIYCDFTHLGELIDTAGELVRDCVFGYLMKSCFEHVSQNIWPERNDETDDDSDGIVG